ncbi:MAG: heavy-metal-associated domain-containing protein [Candidatus Heimdallarchaeota archaeon]
MGRALTRLDGIDLAEASFEKSSAEVKYDEKQIDKQKMIDVIETLGFKVEGEL